MHITRTLAVGSQDGTGRPRHLAALRAVVRRVALVALPAALFLAAAAPKLRI